MPQVDTPYIIGVIREKEKELLEEDEYTRIIQAPSPEEAVRSLVDTAYGVYLERSNLPFEALQARLFGEYRWLADLLDDERLLEFIALREQALRAAGVVLAGSQETLAGAWQVFAEKFGETAPNEKQAVLLAAKEHLLARMDELAYTPLMKEITRLTRWRMATDTRLRGAAVDSDTADGREDLSFLPEFISVEASGAVRDLKDATAYEREWDVHMLQVLAPYRSEPSGVDPVLAYWMALTLEVKTLRLLLAGKLGGMPADALGVLMRPLYLHIR